MKEKKKKTMLTPPSIPSEVKALNTEIERILNVEVERLRGIVVGLEESLSARGSEVIVLRAALEERDKIIATLQSHT